jgi:DNA gyrase/topoisomerase IV subunit B
MAIKVKSKNTSKSITKLAYDEDSIDVNLGLDVVRAAPQVFIGIPDGQGIFQCWKEPLDNSIDDLEASHSGRRVKDTLTIGCTFDGNKYWIYDPGRGIPIGKHAKTGLSTLETVMTTLSAGAKMRGDKKDAAYKGCFVGETKIKLVDGTIRSLKSLTEKEKEFWVFASDKNGWIVPVKANSPRITKWTKTLVRVHLNNGKSELCTPDHEWLLRDGKYKRADQLKRGTSLMPLYTRRDKDGHLEVQTNNPTQTKFVRPLQKRNRAGEKLPAILAAYKPCDKERMAANANNHKVLKIEHVVLDKAVPVYDITVPKHHNFALNSGVFVHNSAGVHGMGVSITNALASYLQAWTYRDNQWWTQTYAKGKPTTKVIKCNAPVVPLAPKDQAKRKQGTVICFTPDAKMFDDGSKLHLKQVREFLQRSAYLHPLVKIQYNDGKIEKTFHAPGGLSSYVKKQLELHEVEAIGNSFTIQSDLVTAVLQWSTSDSDLVETFVNGSPTKEHGKHYDGMMKAIKDSISKYAGKRAANAKEAAYKVEDLTAGMIGVLDCRVSSPRFTTQTKEKLSTLETSTIVYDVMKPALEAYWAKNKAAAGTIIKRAIEIRKLMAGLSANKKAAAALKSKDGKAMLPAKLVGCRTKDASRAELFLVEGDSAGGTAKRARDNEYQAVLKLRGKVLAAYGKNAGKLFTNNEVLDILRAIGYDPSNDDKKKSVKIRYARIILLPDPDVDGKHIAVLLLSLFQRVLPQLIEEGRVFIVDSALFHTFYGGKRYFGDDLAGVRKQLPSGAKANIQRIKGWGEVNDDVLESIAFDPKTRKLTQVRPIADEKLKKFISIVGENEKARKELLGI